MNKLHDPELELFKRALNLADYAKRAGYELRPHDGAPGLTVLEHPNRDRIVVGQSPNGPWIYASVPDYALRAPGEPAEQALARLRTAIDRSQDKGTIVEFVQQRDPFARRGDVPLDQVRERLRTFRATGLPLDFEGALCPPPYPRSRERAVDRDRGPQPSRGSSGPKPRAQSPSLRLESARRRAARERPRSSAGSGSGVRRKRRSTSGSAPRARSSPRPHRLRSPLRFPRTLAERFRTARPRARHDRQSGQVGARASTLRLDPGAAGPRRTHSRASRPRLGGRER